MNRTRRPKLKICGITRLEDARFCAAAGADFLGFIQFRESPRFVSAAKVAEISEWVHGAKTVGVFVNEDVDVVRRVVEETGMAYAQLHGDESPEYCEQVGVPVIKAFRVRSTSDQAELVAGVRRFSAVAEYALLDTHVPGVAGGSGATFDWNVLKGIELDLPFFLAGGIAAANVAQAIDIAGPDGIDVSSSLETEPGIKDFDLLSEFFESFDSLTTA